MITCNEKIDYKELEANCYNKYWEGWKYVKHVMDRVHEISKSKLYPDSKIKHALNFLNNYFVEERVKELLHLNYYGTDHDGIYYKLGVDIPDFIDKKGVTYELKSTWNYDFILTNKNLLNWHGADKKIVYQKSDNMLYFFDDERNTFIPIVYCRAKYIDMKRYPLEDKDLGL